ncbi:aminophospholipid translocase, partial [Coemansia sp. RSA 485]
MSSNYPHHLLSSPYGADDNADERMAFSANTDNTQHSYLNSPLVEDDSISVHPTQPRRPAHQLSVRRAVEREERARREAARNSAIPYADTLQEVDYEESNEYEYSEYGQKSFASMSRPYAKRVSIYDDNKRQSIMERIDDSHLDREHVSLPSRGPSMYQRMQFMDEAEDENDTPLRKASLLLKRQLSKRRSNVPDGALHRSLLGPSDSNESYRDTNIPMQDIGALDGGGLAAGALANEFDPNRGLGNDNNNTNTNNNASGSSDPAFGSGSGDNFRTVHIGNRESNAQFKYKHNRVSTAKYNFLTFLPKFLFEQFSKYANVFFLFTGCIQQIKGVSPTSRFTTIVPLAVVLAATAAKELAEDLKRHRSDADMNKSTARVLVGTSFEERAWRDVQVGDILRVQNKEAIPADIVILSSSEPEGMCYVETSNLDGETNLKVKQALPETAKLMTVADLSGLRGHMKTEVPNDSLYTFEGTLVSEGGRLGFRELPLSPTQV